MRERPKRYTFLCVYKFVGMKCVWAVVIACEYITVD